MENDKRTMKPYTLRADHFRGWEIEWVDAPADSERISIAKAYTLYCDGRVENTLQDVAKSIRAWMDRTEQRIIDEAHAREFEHVKDLSVDWWNVSQFLGILEMNIEDQADCPA